MPQEETTRGSAHLLESAGQGLGKLPRWGLERALRTARRIAALPTDSTSATNLPGQVQALAQTVLRRSGEAARISTSAQSTAATFAELRNKAEVYFLVRGIRHMLGIPSTYPESFPLSFYLDRAYDRDDFAVLFAVEGLGREFGRAQWLQDPDASGLLHESAGLPLPAKSLLMLHAGLGMAFAKELLDHLPQPAADGDLARAIDRFVALCKSNSRAGYQVAALEPLGLVTRTFHAPLTRAIDDVLAANHPELRKLYWHGVGRAIYFLPQNALPCATWEGFLQCEREAVDDLSRDQLFAGHGWAFSMVNLRQPEILLHLFVAPHAQDHPHPDAFRRGIAAACVMRQETTPGTDTISHLLSFPSVPPAVRGDWNHLVLSPAKRALADLAASSSAAAWMNETFRYTEA